MKEHIIEKIYIKAIKYRIPIEELRVYLGVGPRQDDVEWEWEDDYPRHTRLERYYTVRDLINRKLKK